VHDCFKAAPLEASEEITPERRAAKNAAMGHDADGR
jgi:hypothetical protein